MRNPHLDAGLLELGPSPGAGSATVVAVHGRDQDPHDLVDALVDRIDDPSVTWLLPAAADRSWYPAGFQDPVRVNQPWFGHALDRLVDLEGRLAGVDVRSVVWAGFSQGACLVCEHVARRPRRWGGLLVFTGGRIGPPGTDLSIDGRLDGLPVYLGCGDQDPWAPVERIRETAAAFERAGADVTVDVFADDGGHLIRPDEIAAGRRVLDGVSGHRG